MDLHKTYSWTPKKIMSNNNENYELYLHMFSSWHCKIILIIPNYAELSIWV